MEYKNFDYIVVGAGLYGSVVAERLASAGRKVCIVEKRGHVGGNCFDECEKSTGILYHKYGPHIFHANCTEVIDYLHNFTKFNRYFHQVLTSLNGDLYQLPVNLDTINAYYKLSLRPYEVDAFLKKEASVEVYDCPKNMEEKCISLIGRPLYEAFFKGYTLKQWGIHPKKLSASLISRLPVRTNYYNSYYDKLFQGVPTNGYTAMFSKMLTDKNICLQLDRDFFDIKEFIPSSCPIIYTGSIDSFFNYEFGRLEYRTVSFEHSVRLVNDWQGTSVVNYASTSVPFTRICEPKHFYRELWEHYPQDKTLIIKEYSFLDDGSNPCYPISDEKNLTRYRRYKQKAASKKNVFFGGRLGEYRYYDMDDVVKSALDLAKRLVAFA